MRLRWRTGSENYDLARRRSGGWREGPAGELWDKRDGGGRYGVYRDGTVYVECRVAQLVEGNDSHDLIEPGRLLSAARVAATQLRSSGVEVGEIEPTLGRSDPAGELHFDDGRDGQALLHAFGNLDVPWCKVATYGRKRDRIETVVLTSTRGKSVLARMYDKGVESGTHPSGERVRYERQWRFRKNAEPSVAQLVERARSGDALLDARKLAVYERLPVVRVAEVNDAVELLPAICESWQQRRRMLDYLVYGFDARPLSTAYRDAAELRRLGIVVAPGVGRTRVVAIGAALRMLRDEWEAVAA